MTAVLWWCLSRAIFRRLSDPDWVILGTVDNVAISTVTRSQKTNGVCHLRANFDPKVVVLWVSDSPSWKKMYVVVVVVVVGPYSNICSFQNTGWNSISFLVINV